MKDAFLVCMSEEGLTRDNWGAMFQFGSIISRRRVIKYLIDVSFAPPADIV